MTQLEVIHVSGHAVGFDLSQTLVYVPALQLHEIISGSVCLHDPSDHKHWEDWRVWVEIRFYSPYSMLTMSVEPTVSKGWSTDFMMTSVDFVRKLDQFMWLKEHMAQFYLNCLESDGPGNVNMNQLAFNL